MLRFVPPAGYPLKIGQILRAFAHSFSRQGMPHENLSDLSKRLRSKYVFGVSSGRAALAVVLKGLRRIAPDRATVAFPAYTCFTVAASIVRAGLELHPVEVESEMMDFDFAQLEAAPEEGILCVLTSNLFGIVNDVARTKQIAHSKGAFVVDDAAQALGATRNGFASGTSGDVGIYSLGRGKALPAIEGGLIVTDSDRIAEAVRAELALISQPSRAHAVGLLLQMLFYSVFLHPRLYWIPNSLPFLNLGATEFRPEFPITGLPKLSYALLMQLLGSSADASRVRRANAERISNALGSSRAFSTPKPAPNCLPTFIRFPVIARDRATRDLAVSKLRAAGIGAGPFYPTAICDIPGIELHMAPKDYHRHDAEDLSERLFTVPTHQYVKGKDLDRVISVLASF